METIKRISLKELNKLICFDQLCAKVLDKYIDLVDASISDQNCDRLIWQNVLLNRKVCLILTPAFTQYANTDMLPRLTELDQMITDCYIASSLNLTADSANIAAVFIVSGISALQLYVLDNFLCFLNQFGEDEPTGRSAISSISKISPILGDCSFFINDMFNCKVEVGDIKIGDIKYTLDTDGERTRHIVRNVNLLKLARIIFQHLVENESDLFKDELEQLHLLMWSMRSAIIHQISIQAPTGSLHQEILSYVEKIKPFLEGTTSLDLSKSMKLSILNEIINVLTWFGDSENFRTYHEMAQNLSEVKFNLTGCLGVRTQFQEKPVPQLMVNVERVCKEEKKDDTDKEKLVEETLRGTMPLNEKLEDDLLLPDVKFTVESDDGELDKVKGIQLTRVEQAFMATSIKCAYRFGSSSDALLREELLTYVPFLLEHSNSWPVHFLLLELRSISERTSRRRVERSMKQLETLSNTVRNFRGRFVNELMARITNFYSVLPSPFWVIEKHLAELLCSLGAFKSALDVYLRLEQWSEVIDCYRHIGRPDRAEEIIRKKLSEDDQQPDLHCMLGEITGDINHYHRSWKISNQKYSRAPKMLGMHYFALKEYDQALEYYWDSVGINSMQIDVWYRMGFIGLLKEDWELAVTAYRRVLQFDNESFEAWNNLSKAYIRLGDKDRAMRTLQEAIKCNYEEWKIWDNYIAVCADLGALPDVIEAWHRLIDLKGHYVDDQIAAIVVKCLQVDSRLRPKVLELFARVTSTSSGSATIWRLYARLLAEAQGDWSKIGHCLQKSLRQVATSGWEKDIDQMIAVMKHYQTVADDYFQISSDHKQLLASFKLTVNSTLAIVRKAKPDLEAKANQAKVQELELQLIQLDEIYSQIIERLK